MARGYSDAYAPYGTCPRCGRTGRDWGFKYRNLCRRCHAQWRKEKAEQDRKCNLPKRNLKLAEGILVTEHVHKRLERRAQRALRGNLAYCLARIIPVSIAIVAVFLMRSVAQDSDNGPLLSVIMLGGFFLMVFWFMVFQSAWERKVRAKTIALAQVRKKQLEDQRSFYNSPEWKNLRAEVVEEHGLVCQSCGRQIEDPNDLTVDHIKPRSKFPGLALNKSNLQVLCRRCNSAKGANYEESTAMPERQ